MAISFAVRWKDQDGNDKRQEYDSEAKALKAKKWLIERGCEDVDLAIVTKRDSTGMFPAKESQDA